MILQQKLYDLESWLVGTGYRAEVFQPEIQTLSSIDCNVLLAKCLKH